MSAVITLDPLPSSVVVGGTVTFSGRVLVGSVPVFGAYVTPWITDKYRYLKHTDGTVVVAYTDSSGYYSVPWVAWDQDGVLLGTHTFQALENNYVVWSNTRSMTITAAPLLSATLSVSPTSGPVPLAVTFTIGITGGVAPYTWTLDYGDATTPSSGTVAGTKTHTYTQVGTYTATLTVTDALGLSLSAHASVGAGEVFPEPTPLVLLGLLATGAYLLRKDLAKLLKI